MAAALRAVIADGPALAGALGQLLHRRKLHLLHHGAEAAVHEYHDRAAVALGVLRSVVDDVHRLLHRVRSKDQHPESAVAGGLGGLEIVLLRGLDGAEARAAALHVHDDRGQLRRGKIAYALALERYAGAGGAGHGPDACRRRAVDHIYGRDLALALDEAAADLGQAPGQVLGQLRLRGDGVAGEEAYAAPDRGLAYGLVAFHEFLSHSQPSTFTISIAASGHTTAQVPQPMQPSRSMTG